MENYYYYCYYYYYYPYYYDDDNNSKSFFSRGHALLPGTPVDPRVALRPDAGHARCSGGQRAARCAAQLVHLSLFYLFFSIFL